MAIYPGHKKTPTEIFVCDTCGARKRLRANQRHWCDDCKRGSPIEMRRAVDKWRKIQPPGSNDR